MRIVHRDIDAGNVLLSVDEGFVTNFEAAEQSNPTWISSVQS